MPIGPKGPPRINFNRTSSKPWEVSERNTQDLIRFRRGDYSSTFLPGGSVDLPKNSRVRDLSPFSILQPRRLIFFEGPRNKNLIDKPSTQPTVTGKIKKTTLREISQGLFLPIFPLSIFFGIYFGAKKIRGSFKEEGYVDLIFDETDSFLIGKEWHDGSVPDISLNIPFISPRHALIQRAEEEQFFVTDLGSKHGTWIWQGDSWKRLVPLWPYPLEAGTKIALGLIELQKENILLYPDLAVTLVVMPGEESQVLRLSSTLRFEAKPGRMVVQSLVKRESFPESILKKLKRFFSRRFFLDLQELQARADKVEKKGKIKKARKLRIKAVKLAQEMVKESEELAFLEDHPQRQLELGRVQMSFAEFLKRNQRLEEAAFHFENAAIFFRKPSLKKAGQEYSYHTQGKAFQIYKELGEQGEKEANPLASARFFEMAGLNVPWTYGLDFLGIGWSPIQEKLEAHTKAALYYKKLGLAYRYDFERNIRELRKVPKFVEIFEEMSWVLEELVEDLIWNIEEGDLKPEQIREIITNRIG